MKRSSSAASSSSSSSKRRPKFTRQGTQIVYSNYPITGTPSWASSSSGRMYNRSASAFGNETKYFDTQFASTVTAAGTTWADTEVPCTNYVNSSGTAAVYTASALLPSANGSGYGEVDGNRYKLLKIRVRGTVVAGAIADQADAISGGIQCRLLLVMDTQANGAQAQGEDIIQDFGDTGGNLEAFMRVSSTGGRFRILKDDFFILQPAVAPTDGASTSSAGFEGYQFSWQYKPKEPLTCNITSSNATPAVAGLVNNNIFMLAYGRRGNTSTAVTVTGCARAYYVD